MINITPFENLEKIKNGDNSVNEIFAWILNQDQIDDINKAFEEIKMLEREIEMLKSANGTVTSINVAQDSIINAQEETVETVKDIKKMNAESFIMTTDLMRYNSFERKELNQKLEDCKKKNRREKWLKRLGIVVSALIGYLIGSR